jgi:hypothetical protein
MRLGPERQSRVQVRQSSASASWVGNLPQIELRTAAVSSIIWPIYQKFRLIMGRETNDAGRALLNYAADLTMNLNGSGAD